MTPYSEIFNQFLSAIQDYDILEQGQEFAEHELERTLKRAIGDSRNMIFKVSRIDLYERDETLRSFKDDLPEDVIELLVTGMEYFWWCRQLQNTENVHNVLNTRDFTQYAPQNLLFRLRETTEDAEDRWRRAKRHFSHEHVDLTTMGGLIQ